MTEFTEIKIEYTGKFTGNGTTQDIVCGYKPKKVTLYNWTKDGSEIVIKLPEMESDTAIIDKNNKGKILSEAIVLINKGFTVGSSKYVNNDGSEYIWEANE